MLVIFITTKFLFPIRFKYPVSYLGNCPKASEFAIVIEKLQSFIYFFDVLFVIRATYWQFSSIDFTTLP